MDAARQFNNPMLTHDNVRNLKNGWKRFTYPTDIKKNAIDALKQGRTVPDVSKELRIKMGTLYNWASEEGIKPTQSKRGPRPGSKRKKLPIAAQATSSKRKPYLLELTMPTGNKVVAEIGLYEMQQILSVISIGNTLS